MGKRSAPPGALAPPLGWSGGQQTAVRTQLARIADSAVLQNSPRLQRLLRHIVEATLNGEVDRLKAYTLGLEVFDRTPDFDPNIDPIVRVEMGRLRSKLVEYYAGEGKRDKVRIELPKGGLAARIGFRTEQLEDADDESTAVASVPRDVAAAARIRVSTNNLPRQLSSFVGRARELAEVKRLLETSRLVTLVGIGGIGKTRLSLQVAAGTLDEYADGVWLAELGAITDPKLVATAVAQALGVQEPPQTSLTTTLCTHVRSRRLLLLLDNCEHLIEACAELARAMLSAAAGLRILATSREPLAVAGEQVFRLPPLSLPATETEVETISRADAVRLFVERARLRQPGFGFTERRAAEAVVQLCAHLDGIPLALELAAARVGALAIEDINARLNDRFRLLNAGMRTAEPRQQTLRATFDWSYELLTEQERAVLRRLAVFFGGFSLDAAAFVASLSSMDEAAVVDLVSRLVTRSLVVAETAESLRRYRLLETTRAYALEKLVERGERADVEKRHANYFRKRFESSHDDWLRQSSAAWRAAYLPDLENVRAALDWALGPEGDRLLGFGLASATGPMWIELALRNEGRRRLQAAGAAPPPAAQLLERARVALWLGMLWGDVTPAQALPPHEQAVELYRQAGDAAGLGFALVQLAFTLVSTGEYERSAAVLAEAHRRLQSTGLPRALARYSEAVGFLKLQTRELEGTREHFERSLALYRRMGAERDALRMLGNIAGLRWALGDLNAAVAGYREAVAVRRQSSLTNKSMLGFALSNLAGVLVERGELDEALACAREGVPLLKDLGLSWFNMDHLALRTALVGNVAGAARVAGYLDAVRTEKRAPRGPSEARAYDRLSLLLRERLGAQEQTLFATEGALLSEEEACRIVLEQ